MLKALRASQISKPTRHRTSIELVLSHLQNLTALATECSGGSTTAFPRFPMAGRQVEHLLRVIARSNDDPPHKRWQSTNLYGVEGSRGDV